MMNLKNIAESTGLSLQECQLHRIDYLTRHILERTQDAAWLLLDDGELSPQLGKRVLVEIEPEKKELRYLKSLLSNTGKRHSNILPPDMIEQARCYPIEQIVNFEHGKAVAFCHNDTEPSLIWHKNKNKATCFPCAKSYNPIDVLVQRDGYSFQDAVRSLTA